MTCGSLSWKLIAMEQWQRCDYTITCACISIRIFSIILRSFHGMDHFCVTWTVSAHFPAARRVSHGCSMRRAVRIASSRSGTIQKFAHSRRSIPTDTSRMIARESSVYVSSSVRMMTSERRCAIRPIFGRFVLSRSPVAQKRVMIRLVPSIFRRVSRTLLSESSVCA